MSRPLVSLHPKAAGQVSSALPENRSGIAPFCAISLPHAQVLVAPPTGDCQSRVLAKGDNPRFVVTNLPKQHVGSIHNVYEKLVLRAWRYGEPHQGTAAVSVCPPHQLFADACQSAATINFLVRICADAGLAVAGIESYAVRQRTMLDAAGETFENRCAGGCQRPRRVWFSWSENYPWQRQFSRVVANLKQVQVHAPPA